jgi:Flp pilus assembly protein TadB
MRVLILAFCGLLLLGSAAAFLLYVSILSILTVVVILMAAMLMFVLGVQVEKQRRRVPEIPPEEIMPPVQETRAPFGTSVLCDRP